MRRKESFRQKNTKLFAKNRKKAARVDLRNLLFYDPPIDLCGDNGKALYPRAARLQGD
jgi:hypothetical protein